MKNKILFSVIMLLLFVAIFASCACSHRDANDDSLCDLCEAEYTDNVDICTHRDLDDNNACDKCGEPFSDGPETPACTHRDIDDNDLCDECGEPFSDGSECPSCSHRDIDDNDLCDECGEQYTDGDEESKVYHLWWDTSTPIKLKATENSNNLELPSTCARYLAGTLTEWEKHNDYSQVDINVSKRNIAAYNTTEVHLTYEYFKDGDVYTWSKCSDVIFSEVISHSTGRADIYCNFVYDMVSATLKGAFTNLLCEERGTNYFEFLEPGFEDTGEGYMYEYMRSLSLSKNKMYCLASDYFTDMARAFLVVPVNIGLLQSIQVDPECNTEGYNPDAATKYNSDRTGDGKFNIDDLYNLVWDGQWNYSILADYSRAVHQSSGDTDTNGNLSDTIGFAISSAADFSASGLLYSSSVSIISSEWSEDQQEYRYGYPRSASELYELCDAITGLFSNNKGVIAVNNSAEQCMGYGPDALSAIRGRFASGKVLFGGIVCLGSLEYDEYKTMNKDDGHTGYGIVPVPLYREVNPETGEPDKYLTQIHSIGRIGAISYSTEKFSQCSAFLDYQSLNSTNVLDGYFEYKHYFVTEDRQEKNTEMLRFIRHNVRSSFDKVYEDMVCDEFTVVEKRSCPHMWHNMIMNAGYIFDRTAMTKKYDEIARIKDGYLGDISFKFKDLPAD